MSSGGTGDARTDDGKQTGSEVVMPDAAFVKVSPSTGLSFRSDEIYQRIEMIGKGTYGSVYKARAPEGHLVALKKVRMDCENQGFPITAIREIKILQALQHENVIQLDDVVASRDSAVSRNGSSVFMVFPFMDHDLTGLLENPQVVLSVPQIKFYLRNILLGLHHVHKRKILHRDIKGPNVLISNTGEVKLADFGLARFVNDDAEYTANVVTLWYRPPELLFGAKKYSTAVDIWSIGCVFAEMLTSAPAFPGATEIDQIERIFKVCGSPTPETWPGFSKLPGAQKIKLRTTYPRTFRQKFGKYGDKGLDLLEKLLCLNPDGRISAGEALQHDYFWTEPFPIDPKLLPSYSQSHEYKARLRKQQRQEALRQQQIPNKRARIQGGQGPPRSHHPHHGGSHHHHVPLYRNPDARDHGGGQHHPHRNPDSRYNESDSHQQHGRNPDVRNQHGYAAQHDRPYQHHRNPDVRDRNRDPAHQQKRPTSSYHHGSHPHHQNPPPPAPQQTTR